MYIVGRNDGQGPKFAFGSYNDAVDKINEIAVYDPDGVYNGDYYIDMTEQEVRDVEESE